jgi:hypothetical protein
MGSEPDRRGCGLRRKKVYSLNAKARNIFHMQKDDFQYWNALFLTVGNALNLSKQISTEEKVFSKNPEWVEKMIGKPRFLPFF